jgi:hypothetical protein
MNRFLAFSVVTAAMLPLLPACAANEVFPVAHTEPIAVRVADGNSGKPLQNQHVLLVAGYDRRDLDLALWREEAVTDGEGKARLSNTLRNLPLLRVKVLKRHNCEPGSDEGAFSMDRIRMEGLSGVDRCGDPAVQDAPGVVTVFVKGRKGDVAGVVVPPPPLAPPPLPTHAALSAPESAVVASVPGQAESSSRPAADHETGPQAGSALPPVPFALPDDFFAAAAAQPDSGAELVALPEAPRVIARRHSAIKPSPPVVAAAAGKPAPDSAAAAKPAPVSPSAKPASPEAAHPAPALRHAVALERMRRRAAGGGGRGSSPDALTARPRFEDPNPVKRSYSHGKPSAGRGVAPGPQRLSKSEVSEPVHSWPVVPDLPLVSSPMAADPPDEDDLGALCVPDAGQP